MIQSEAVQAFRPIAELLPEQWITMVITAEDGTPIHVMRTGGDQPALILLHGIQVSGLMWLLTARAFEADFDVIMPDSRGHGQSGNLDNGLSSALLVSDLMTIIEALNVHDPFVVGHSMGADVAGRLAAAMKLRGVVLVDPALINIAAMLPPMDDELPPYMQPILNAIEVIRSGTHAEKMQAGLNLLPPGAPIPDEEDYVGFVEGHGGFDVRVYKNMAALGYLCEEPETIASIDCPLLLMTARPHIAYLQARLAELKTQIQAHIPAHPALADTVALLQTIKGVGPVVAWYLVAEIDIARFASAKELVAFLGLNPHICRSGKRQNTASPISKMGNAALRRVLYMPTITAKQHNLSVKQLYDRLIERGKHQAVARIAAMRKLVHIIYGVWTSGQPFDAHFEANHLARAP